MTDNILNIWTFTYRQYRYRFILGREAVSDLGFSSGTFHNICIAFCFRYFCQSRVAPRGSYQNITLLCYGDMPWGASILSMFYHLLFSICIKRMLPRPDRADELWQCQITDLGSFIFNQQCHTASLHTSTDGHIACITEQNSMIPAFTNSACCHIYICPTPRTPSWFADLREIILLLFFIMFL